MSVETGVVCAGPSVRCTDYADLGRTDYAVLPTCAYAAIAAELDADNPATNHGSPIRMRVTLSRLLVRHARP